MAEPAKYKTVICLVAGTGISGAIAIAGAFKELKRQSVAYPNPGPSEIKSQSSEGSPNQANPVNDQVGCTSAETGKARIWTRCIIIWSVRETQYIALPELQSEHVQSQTPKNFMAPTH